MNPNTSRPIPAPDTGSAVLNWLARASTRLTQFERRFDGIGVFDAFTVDAGRYREPEHATEPLVFENVKLATRSYK